MGLVKPCARPHPRGMSVSREEILVLGLTAGVVGSLVGGLTLYAGLALVVAGSHAGWLLALPAAPLGGGLGYLLARKLAARLKP
jgi:hypothetical protein